MRPRQRRQRFADAADGGRVVERRQLREPVQFREHLPVHPDRLHEALAAVHHPMADRLHPLEQALLAELVEQLVDRMARRRALDFAFREALAQPPLSIHLREQMLEAGAPAVDGEDDQDKAS